MNEPGHTHAGESSERGRTVSLVQGSGGARGLAHIGVIRHLEEFGYRIRSIAGCSMGALIGGIYAAGKLDAEEIDMLEIANQAFDAMQGAISRYKLAAYPPDIVVTIPRNAATIVEFDRARELIELGHETARRQLDD